jgi:hypothetical protein
LYYANDPHGVRSCCLVIGQDCAVFMLDTVTVANDEMIVTQSSIAVEHSVAPIFAGKKSNRHHES